MVYLSSQNFNKHINYFIIIIGFILRSTFVLLVLLSFYIDANTQEIKNELKVDSLPQISFESTSYDFGIIHRGNDTSFK